MAEFRNEGAGEYLVIRGSDGDDWYFRRLPEGGVEITHPQEAVGLTLTAEEWDRLIHGLQR